MFKIPELTRMDVACNNIAFAPDMAEIPEKFHDRFNNKHCEIAAKLFYNGGRMLDHGMRPREGVDMGKAMFALGAWLRSWERKHEHKISIAGYLIDQWFEPIEVAKHEQPHRKKA